MNEISNLLKSIHQAASPSHGDRGMLAALRRGFSEATESYAWPYLAPHCDITDSRQRIIWQTVAGAAAILAPQGLERSGAGVGNMGATLRKLAFGASSERGDKALSSFENRFRRLLTCQTTEELCRHIINPIRAASAKAIPVDVEQLFWDLQKWENPSEPTTKLKWAQVYWMGEDARKGEGVS